MIVYKFKEPNEKIKEFMDTLNSSQKLLSVISNFGDAHVYKLDQDFYTYCSCETVVRINKYNSLGEARRACFEFSSANL